MVVVVVMRSFEVDMGPQGIFGIQEALHFQFLFVVGGVFPVVRVGGWWWDSCQYHSHGRNMFEVFFGLWNGRRLAQQQDQFDSGSKLQPPDGRGIVELPRGILPKTGMTSDQLDHPIDAALDAGPGPFRHGGGIPTMNRPSQHIVRIRQRSIGIRDRCQRHMDDMRLRWRVMGRGVSMIPQQLWWRKPTGRMVAVRTRRRISTSLWRLLLWLAGTHGWLLHALLVVLVSASYQK